MKESMLKLSGNLGDSQNFAAVMRKKNDNVKKLENKMKERADLIND